MTIMLVLAVLILAITLAILAGLSALAARELINLRAAVVKLEREAGDAAGEVKGLKAAIETAGLGMQLAAAKGDNVKLLADLDRMRDNQRAALERAQTAPSMVALPSPYYPRNGG